MRRAVTSGGRWLRRRCAVSSWRSTVAARGCAVASPRRAAVTAATSACASGGCVLRRWSTARRLTPWLCGVLRSRGGGWGISVRTGGRPVGSVTAGSTSASRGEARHLIDCNRAAEGIHGVPVAAGGAGRAVTLGLRGGRVAAGVRRARRGKSGRTTCSGTTVPTGGSIRRWMRRTGRRRTGGPWPDGTVGRTRTMRRARPVSGWRRSRIDGWRSVRAKTAWRRDADHRSFERLPRLRRGRAWRRRGGRRGCRGTSGRSGGSCRRGGSRLIHHQHGSLELRSRGAFDVEAALGAGVRGV